LSTRQFYCIVRSLAFLLDKKLFFKFLANVSFSAENLSSPSFLATLSRLHLQIFVVSSFHLAPDR
jgi:hypothetical protein